MLAVSSAWRAKSCPDRRAGSAASARRCCAAWRRRPRAPQRRRRPCAWPASQDARGAQAAPPRRAVARPFVAKALPGPGTCAVARLRRTQRDAQRVRQLPALFQSARARPAAALRPAQAGNALTAQTTAWQRVDTVRERLMRDGARRIVGPHAPQWARKLARAPSAPTEPGAPRQGAQCRWQAVARVRQRWGLKHRCRARTPAQHASEPLRGSGPSPLAGQAPKRQSARAGRTRATKRLPDAACSAALFSHHPDPGALFRGQILVMLPLVRPRPKEALGR